MPNLSAYGLFATVILVLAGAAIVSTMQVAPADGKCWPGYYDPTRVDAGGGLYHYFDGSLVSQLAKHPPV